MSLVVPFDGSKLARTALVRAVEFARVLDESVVAVTVIPAGNRSYARERGWLDPGEMFDMETVVSNVHRRVTKLAPSADFRHRVVDGGATAGTIASRVKKLAIEEEAAIVFIGSENAGHLATALSSVGSSVAAADAYDVHIVRHARPSKVQALADASPYHHERSDFYFPE